MLTPQQVNERFRCLRIFEEAGQGAQPGSRNQTTQGRLSEIDELGSQQAEGSGSVEQKGSQPTRPPFIQSGKPCRVVQQVWMQTVTSNQCAAGVPEEADAEQGGIKADCISAV